MTRLTLAAAIAALLLLAMALGALLHWLWTRMADKPDDAARIGALMAQTHAAEANAAAAQARTHDAETAAAAACAERDAAVQALDAARSEAERCRAASAALDERKQER